jgi:hypothetical protein
VPIRRSPSPDLPSRRALAAALAHRRSPNRRRPGLAPAAEPDRRERAITLALVLALVAGGAWIASGEPEPCPCHSGEDASETVDNH